MQSESFIAGKDASLASPIHTPIGLAPGDDAFWRGLLDGELRFFGQPPLGPKLAGCDMHQRLLAGYATLHGN